MAVSANALTLPQYAIMSNDPLVQRITYSLLQYGNVMADIPFLNRASLIANGVRWEGTLPTINWSKLNVDPVVTSGTPTPYQEQSYIIRNAIDVDMYLVQDANQIVEPRGAQIDAYLQALTYDFNDKFINNDHVAGNADAIVGLRYRITTDPTTFRVRSENSIDAGGVAADLSAITATTANQFLELLDQLLWSVASADGSGVVLYMNEVLKRRFARALRVLGTGGGYSLTRDNFGRTIEAFRNARISDIGYKPTAGTQNSWTRIITNTETLTGAAGASTFTSLYAVRYGDQALAGWQFAPLAATDIGLIGNGGATYRTVINWNGGLFPMHTRCMARMYDLKIS